MTVNAVAIDRAGVDSDPAFSFLSEAFEPSTILEQMARSDPPLRRSIGEVSLKSIRVLRHKPGRRCLIEYVFSPYEGSGKTRSFALLGKVRAKGLDRRSESIQSRMYRAETEAGCTGQLLIPEVVGRLPEFHMWLQRRVPGTPVGEHLSSTYGKEVAERAAVGLAELHKMDPVVKRDHSIEDELDILTSRLRALGDSIPNLRSRLEGVTRECRRIADELSERNRTGIHRDFYHDNVLTDGRRLWIIDLDLYACGHPAIDVGNFSAHLIELGIRFPEIAGRLRAASAAFESRYLDLATVPIRPGELEVCKTLTLARHISISAQMRDRMHATIPLLDLVERRLEGTVEAGVGTNRRRL